jgi:hypothetical protein
MRERRHVDRNAPLVEAHIELERLQRTIDQLEGG